MKEITKLRKSEDYVTEEQQSYRHTDRQTNHNYKSFEINNYLKCAARERSTLFHYARHAPQVKGS